MYTCYPVHMNPQLIEQGIERRRVMLRFIRDYVDEHGYAPSVREIMAGADLSSPHAVRRHLVTLQEEGKIQVTPNIARGIRVLEPSD